jgi:hypothetical protein
MNFAHIAGEHETQSTTSFAGHILLSWVGVIIAAVMVGGILYLAYKRLKLNAQKEKIQK